MIPLFIDMAGKNVAVFGAGPVGIRKANYFIREAEVVAVAKHFAEGLDPRVRKEISDAREVMHEWIDWADLVIAATDDKDLNILLTEEASYRGKPYNSADGPSSFLIPSLVAREGYSIAISTHGRSPAMSRFLRLKLERDLDEKYSLMIMLQEELRGRAMASIPFQREREIYLRSVLEDEKIWDLLPHDHEEASRLALDKLRAHTDTTRRLSPI